MRLGNSLCQLSSPRPSRRYNGSKKSALNHPIMYPSGFWYSPIKKFPSPNQFKLNNKIVSHHIQKRQPVRVGKAKRGSQVQLSLSGQQYLKRRNSREGSANNIQALRRRRGKEDFVLPLTSTKQNSRSNIQSIYIKEDSDQNLTFSFNNANPQFASSTTISQLVTEDAPLNTGRNCGKSCSSRLLFDVGSKIKVMLAQYANKLRKIECEKRQLKRINCQLMKSNLIMKKKYRNLEKANIRNKTMESYIQNRKTLLRRLCKKTVKGRQ